LQAAKDNQFKSINQSSVVVVVPRKENKSASKSKARKRLACRRHSFPSSIVCSLFFLQSPTLARKTSSLIKRRHHKRTKAKQRQFVHRKRKGIKKQRSLNKTLVQRAVSSLLKLQGAFERAMQAGEFLAIARDVFDNSSCVSSRKLRPDNLRPSKFSSGASHVGIRLGLRKRALCASPWFRFRM
jgi:hypothetical protein